MKRERSLLVAFAATLVGLLIVVQMGAIARDVQRPRDLSATPYAQSSSCVTCHPFRYETWYRTYHRTMTQEADPQSVLGDFDNASSTYEGVTSRFFRDGDRFVIETLSLDGHMQNFDVVMTVGSRRIQQYVTKIGDRHVRLPLAWNIEESRWIHLNGGFLHPDGSDFNTHTALWDVNCIFCHNVKAEPRYDELSQTFDSRVAELGVACEACHGPAQEHVQLNRNMLRRYWLYLRGRDPTVHSPHEMSDLRQIQMCGHCHGQRMPRPLSRIAEFIREGDPYTAGEDLDQYTEPIAIDSHLQGQEMALRFWADGTPRLTAYEYQGLLLSEEHAGSGLTCISCHDMHGGDPRGMIRDEMRGPQACTQCHTEIGADIAAHTRHPSTSSGSSCIACHMPPITYGLLAIHPTHHIRSPDPSRAWRHEMPEACTLCHVDRSALWAHREAGTLFESLRSVDLPSDPERFGVAEAVRTALGGDVLQRAVALEALSSGVLYRAVGNTSTAGLWVVPFLLLATEDSYPAIRHFAFRGLVRVLEKAEHVTAIQGWHSLPDFDYLATIEQRTRVLASWTAWWQELDKSALVHPGQAVPLDPDFQPDPQVVARLRALQEDKIIAIGE